MFITQKELINGFLNEEIRILHLKVDEEYYDVLLYYIPFNSKSNIVCKIVDIEVPIQLFLLSCDDFRGIQSIYANVFLPDLASEDYNMKTLQIDFIRIIEPKDEVCYLDLLLRRIDETNNKLKNLKALEYKVKSYDSIYSVKK
ncbi:hypothetical protein [Cytophaga hutchinsonii]|uniref:Uncharacterized protein n=1 Tax=Cytophaga hutchinsonii (strain ATCC 33406 / DSM 1761 / CIP 103989 / NBRC 15051 / NCIMB 9469 / D465) TaxID=269798 RepID=A0A6N4SUX1_CYTH3|nr:hypothetical protein [Cytophaga hutchinsonii]ABG60203.1 hypothetical protein CHU_2961 [Cytophaga hutchinsonii ATCC 33406]SFX22026.1 hypothetical protein SAMN04487930_102100 [Cytophaga hutchinsonii ATCC 33406]